MEPLLDLFQFVTAPYHWFNDLTDLVFMSVNVLFGRYGTPVVFIAALAEATVGVGVVFPGVIIMFLGGAAAARGDGSVASVFLVALAGTVLGDVISYALGRWGARFLQGTRFGPSLRVASELMRGKALWLLPFYHLNSVTRTLGPFGAGALRMRLVVWAPLDFLGAAVANVVWVGLGYGFGTALLTEDGRLKDFPVLRIGLAVAAVVWVILVQRMYDERMRAKAVADAASATEGAPAA